MSKVTLLLASQQHNRNLADRILNELNTHDIDAEIIDLVNLDLPLYSTKTQESTGIPPIVTDLFKACEASDGFVFVAPEYNGGIPPVLTNAIAWLSVNGKEWRGAFNTKIAGIASFSGGGGMQLIIALRSQLAYLGLTVIGRAIQTTHQKPLKDESLSDFAAQLIDRL